MYYPMGLMRNVNKGLDTKIFMTALFYKNQQFPKYPIINA